MMGPEVIFYSLAILLVLILASVQIGIALGVTSVIGVYLAYGDLQIALSILGSTAYDAIRSHALAVIPLFMLMGEIISRSGAAADLYRLCDRVLGRLSGRLAAATVLGNAAFAAVSGVAIASAATFSRIAYPEMRRSGYAKSYALGVIAGSGSLGMLIPPSVLLIVWAILTEGSVGALFVAGVIPGLLLGLAFVAYCSLKAVVSTGVAPAVSRITEQDGSQEAGQQGSQDAAALRRQFVSALGIVGLVVLVLGGIWSGVFTPTAAAGFDPIAFAIYGIIVIEAGLLTPPMGLLIFTVKSSVTDPDVTLGDIFRGSVPFWILMLAVAVLVLWNPWLATWLPRILF